jgi:serine/threonine protein kinase
MESAKRGGDDHWLREVFTGPDDGSRSNGPATPAPALPPAWMELIDGPSLGKSTGWIGPYRIDRRIGRGGMGVVFQAYDSALRRVVAVKFLSPRLAVSPLARLRFAREAQAAAAINHPNVVTIHAISEHEGLPYLVMEFVAGITLADRLKREGVLDRKSVLRIGIQIARGLAAAHAQGLIHRDVKPANILLESGLDRVKITDFGLACVMAEPWRLTASGALLGTPPYMSPEQANSAALDHRSDLFSLGSVLYHLCTGEPPFPGPTIKTVLTGVRAREPRPIRDLNPEIPPVLEDHIRRLMAKDPADRFSSATELVRVLFDQLAEIQGKRPDRSADDPDEEIPEPAPRPPRPDPEIENGNWDDPAPEPKGGPTIWRQVLPVIGVAMVVAIVAFAMVSYLPSWRRDFGNDASIILLLAFAGLAVSTWVVAKLATIMRRWGAGGSTEGRTVGVLRNALATAILLPTAGTAYLEWSAYAQSARALKAVNARQVNWIDSAPPSRKEVETLIGRTAEDLWPGAIPGQFGVTYRWRGVFRTYVLRARYLRLRYDMRNPRAKPAEGEEGFDTLYWISDVLE